MEDMVFIPEALASNIVFDADSDTYFVLDAVSRRPDVMSFCSIVSRTRYAVENISMEAFSAKQTGDMIVSGSEPTTDTLDAAIKMFGDAASRNASDIHVRMHETHADVLYRVNGSLQQMHQLPRNEAESMLTAIYGSMADIADPVYNPTSYQDARIGKAKFLPRGLHGIRVACGPQVGGTLMVMRLLYGNTEEPGGTVAKRLDRLGYTEDHTKLVNFMRSRPTGVNVVAGPTGSGKSTTLKHILESIHKERPDLNILSVEDPPEYPMKGVAQLPVTNADTDAERKAAFGSAIRAALRMDPDIIMIGEIRDTESAKLAVRAAMTGHQVWTTLHANSAFNIFNRLADIMSDGDDSDPLAILSDITVTTGLVFQRLGKTLCNGCKRPLIGNENRVDSALLHRIDLAVLTREGVHIKGDGCPSCKNSGVSGRTVLAEVVATDPEMLKILKNKGIDDARRYWLKQQSGRTALSHGLQKIRDGILDPGQTEEVVGLLTTDLLFGDNTLSQEELDDI